MSSQAAQVSVGSVGEGLYLGLNGRATQRVCPTADKLISDYLTAHPGRPSITLDLTDCAWVDSTFAGWLVRLHKRLERIAGARLLLAGCSERCRTSFDKLRLSEMFEFGQVQPPEHVRAVQCSGGDRPDRAMLELMVAAHEELAALDAQSERVFAPIAHLLREQLKDKS